MPEMMDDTNSFFVGRLNNLGDIADFQKIFEQKKREVEKGREIETETREKT